jgi:ligand-binding sensor protein/AraC-like DNA-binding protein
LNTKLYKLKEITDHDKWRSLQDSMAEVTGMAILTIDYKGEPVTHHSFRRDFCRFVRSNPETCKYCKKCDSRGGLEAVRLNKPYIYHCYANIVDVAIPIIIDEHYIGAVMAGEVRLPDSESGKLEKILQVEIPELSEEDKCQMEDAFNRLPVYPLKKIEMMTRLIENFSKYVVEEAIIKNALYDLNERLLKGVPIPGINDESKKGGDIYVQKGIAEQFVSDIPQPDQMYSSIVSKTIEFVRSRVSDSVSLEMAAKHCHVSSSYLSRVFKREVGMNFSEYVTKQKVSYAKNRILTTDKSVAEISNELGFSDCGYFIKCFSRYEGMTPAAYRKYIFETYSLHSD